MPLVSVLLPNYNHARYLPKRLESIRRQTFTDYELIALDDCSTDESREVLTAAAQTTPMRLVFNEANSGSPFLQWRRGAELATGEFLWIAESDDFADPRLLERLLARIEAGSEIGLSYCQSWMVNEADEIIGKFDYLREDIGPERWNADYTNQGRDEVARFLIKQNTIPNASAVLVRRDLLLDACNRLPKMRLMGDWWTWATILLQTNVAFTAEPLNHFRIHSASVRNSTRRATASLELLQVAAHICSQVEVPESTRREVVSEAYNHVWKCITDTSTPYSTEWLAQVRDYGCRVHPSAGGRLSWLMVKRKLKRIPLANAMMQRLKGRREATT